MARKLVGEVWVDSGQVMIVDPCYLGDWTDNDLDDEDKDSRNFSYSGACRATLSPKQFDQLEHGAVASSTAYGDGCYPVYANVVDGIIESLTIEFVND